MPIEAERFHALAAEYLARMRSEDAFDDGDYLAMIRLWNTIEFDGLGRSDPQLADYASAFFPAHVQGATTALAMTPTKGMALHSAQHDVYIGGKPHANSRFHVLDAAG